MRLSLKLFEITKAIAIENGRRILPIDFRLTESIEVSKFRLLAKSIINVNSTPRAPTKTEESRKSGNIRLARHEKVCAIFLDISGSNLKPKNSF